MAGRTAHDLPYIRNWPFALDCWILALTAIHGFVHKNAC
jgi:lipopolysaccharide/colanic/teichoic acid biosynthesis glycosyltransferase